ncbi:hypothetical protein CK203_074336 [Vitis vinifera]|uniref:Uncharacterized protein n=1 Tax=Vitis vinifera TaxID=29760 RepID=A0A438BYL6_VITVI|nr:hypothetical protein CK203_074336 [Vitis vinifera]
MDGHAISPTKVLDSVVIPAKGIRTRCPDAPSDGFVSHDGSVVIATLLAAVRTVVMGRGPWLVVVIARKTRFTLVNDPDNYIRIAHVGYPDVLWSGRIYGNRPDAYALVMDFGMGILVVLIQFWAKECLQARELFHLPGPAMLGEDVVSTEQAEGRAMTFSKEQFNAGLRSLCRVVQGIPPFLQDSTSLHPSEHRPVLMGCSIINMLFNLDLTLLEGGAKGLVVVRGAWAGFLERPGRPFSPNYSMELPGTSGDEGYLVDWVEKASFACLNKLFEIDAKERHYKTLLSARNLMAVVWESQEYIVNILPRKMPKKVVLGEHYTVKDLPIYQESKESDAENAEHSWIIGRRKRTKEPFGRLLDRNAAQPLLQIKLQRKRGRASESCSSLYLKRIRTRRGAEHSSTSLAAVARLDNLAEEAASINHPDSPNPDVDAAEAVCATPMEEVGAESQSQPSDDPDRLALVLVKGSLQRGLARRAI